MNIVKSWGLRLLAAYLIVVGAVALIPALKVIPELVIALLAVAAGILILISR